jgi:hypothetical protein
MWPSGEAEVGKTFYDGSNPSVTADKDFFGKQSLDRRCFYIAFFICKINIPAKNNGDVKVKER